MTDIVPSVSLVNLLNQRNALVDRIDRAMALLREAREIAEAARITSVQRYHSFDWLVTSDHRSSRLIEADGLAAIVKSIDAAAWDYLMRESGLQTFMDTKARHEWDKQIREVNCPPLTEENIASTFRTMHHQRGEMFDRGVIQCFKTLSWCFKTNSPVKFGRRIVMHGLVSEWGWYSDRTTQLDDLQRVFCVLDGKPEEDTRTGLVSRLRTARGQRLERRAGELDDVYVHLRWYRNGNAHVTFKRPDLVEKMNAILSKHYPDALPEARAA